MKIKALITLAVSANKEILLGQEYDLNEADAKSLIERGFAESVKSAPASNKPNNPPKPASGGAKPVPPATGETKEKDKTMTLSLTKATNSLFKCCGKAGKSKDAMSFFCYLNRMKS